MKSSPFDCDLARSVLVRLRDQRLIGDRLSLDGQLLKVRGAGALVIPEEERGKWRPMINGSLFPQSVSPEAKRHLLYAVLQDFLREELLLRQDTTKATPLRDLDPELEPFEKVYQSRSRGRGERVVLFPLHISVPLVFDTYERGSKKRQTDKGFRGTILRFLSTDAAGFPHELLVNSLAELFASTNGFNVLDRVLVRALHRRFAKERSDELRKLAPALLSSPDADWQVVYKTAAERDKERERDRFRPLQSFALQGQRLIADLQVISRHPSLSRIDRIARVETLLSYHLALYLLRLTRVLYEELDAISARLMPDGSPSEWHGRAPEIRLLVQSKRAKAAHIEAYAQTMSRVNEAVVLLPVLNNVELALRTVYGNPAKPLDAAKLLWAEASTFSSAGFDREGADAVLGVLRFLAALALEYAGADDELRLDLLRGSPISAFATAMRMHFSQPDQHRYATVLGGVFQQIADVGRNSFIQEQPKKYFALGDDLLSLLVLAKFEEPTPNDFGVTESAPTTRSRRRMSLTNFEQRLEEDLVVPADDAARDELRSTLSRLGLLDRLSDVGGANFLRHPLNG